MKAKVSIIIFGIAMVITVIPAQAQTNPMPDATFKIVSQIDQQSGDTIRYNGVFLVRGNELKWGPNARDATVFAVESGVGTWDKATNTGVVTCNVKFADFAGTVKFIGEKGWLIIETVLEFDGQSSKDRLFAETVIYE